MGNKIEYDKYDIYLPDVDRKAKTIFSKPETGLSDQEKDKQYGKIKVLVDGLMEEQQLEMNGESLPRFIVPSTSTFYLQFLALRLSTEPPAQAFFILDHHREHFEGNAFATPEQFVSMVELRLLKDVDGWNMPDNVERCNQVREWVYKQKGPGKNNYAGNNQFHYWPYPSEKLTALYQYLFTNELIEENSGFEDSFRSFKGNRENKTVWKAETKMLVGLFYKLNNFISQYQEESLHAVIVKLFRNKSGEDYDPKILNQTLLNYSSKYESGEGIGAETKALFDFVDDLKLSEKTAKS